MPERVTIDISWRSLWKILAVAALVAGIFVARDVIVAILLAVVIAAGLDPLVTWLQRRRIPRILGTLAVYIILIFVIAVLLYVVVPIILTELNTFLENGSDVFGAAIESFGIKSTLLQTLVSALNEFTNNLLGGKTTLVSVMSQLLGGLLLSVIVFVTSFYLTLGRDGVERFFRAVLPQRFHLSVVETYERTRAKISHWFMGQLFLSLMVGLMVHLGLALLGVEYAFVLGVIAAIFELVPYVGPIFAGSLAVLTALSDSPTLGLYALMLFVGIQQLESHLLIPIVNRYTTNLNPVIVIVSLLIGGKIIGIPGVILAVPFAVLFQEVLRQLNKREEQVVA